MPSRAHLQRYLTSRHELEGVVADKMLVDVVVALGDTLPVEEDQISRCHMIIKYKYLTV